MRELTLPDLEKLDVIEVSAEQNIKICNWIDENISRISNVNNIFDKVIYKITNKENYYYLLYFQFQKEELLCKVYKGHDSLKSPIHHYDFTTNFTTKDYLYFLQEKYELCDIYVNITYQKYFYDKNILLLNNEEELRKRTQNNSINFIMWYYNILAYSQLNQEHVIRQTRTHTKKIQSKKDKRAGKKPKVKLVKQNIIRLNTNHIHLTKEEKKHYERHTLGWTVRGHWRTYQDGKKIWIKPHLRGDRENVQGKTYIIN